MSKHNNDKENTIERCLAVKNEPIYDDIQIAQNREQKIRKLIRALACNGNELCAQIVELRKEVNSLQKQLNKCFPNDKTSTQDPYPDLYENIFMDFSDFDAYEEFKAEFTA